MKNVVILGAGDFGKEVLWLIEDINKANPTYCVVGFLDDDPAKIGQIVNGCECLGPISILNELCKEQDVYAVIANQNGKIRKKIIEQFPDFQAWETLIHPSVNISDTSSIGKGCIICAGSNISVNTVVGNHCLLNITVTLGHDCIVGDYVSIMSGSCVCGHVTIEDGAYLATNCTIVPKMKVGEEAKIGAGSVVLRSVKDHTTVMGIPARVLKL